MQFAVCRWNLDASDETIAALHEHGVTAVEPGPNFLLGLSEDEVATAGRKLAAAGIEVYSCHTAFGPGYDLSQRDDTRRAAAVSVCMQTVLRAAAAGVKCLIVHPSSTVSEADRPEREAKFWDSLEVLLRSAEDAGVRLALENLLQHCLACDGASLRRLVEKFDSPSLGVCFDVGHANLTDEGVAATFAAVRDRVIAFHLQDNDGHRDQHVQPPYGTIDWDTLAPAVAAMDFAHPAAIEAPPWNRGSVAGMLWEMESLFAGRLLTTRVDGKAVRVVCSACGHYAFGTSADWTCACRRKTRSRRKALETER